MTKSVVRNYTGFIDGIGKLGEIDSLDLPKLTLVTDELRGGGMDGAIEVDLGIEKMEAGFSMNSYDADVFKRFGLTPGVQVPFTFRAATIGEDGEKKAVIVNLRARIKEIETGEMKPGERTMVDVMLAVDYYRHRIGAEVVNDIDPIGGVRIVNGVDQTSDIRRMLGVL